MNNRTEHISWLVALLGAICINPVGGYAMDTVYLQTLEEARVKTIIHALSSEHLEAGLKQLDELNMYQLSCEQQLKEKRLPKSCFVAVHLSEKLEIAFKYTLTEVENWCLRIADEGIDLSAKALVGLPQSCVFRAAKKIQINRYKAGMDIEL